MKTLIKNVKIIDGGKIIPGSILVENRKICAMLPPNANIEGAIVYDYSNFYASAGFIDTHTHGGGGHDFMDGTVEAFLSACRMHLKHGTTTIIPTTLSASEEELIRCITAFREAREELKDTQCLHGMHMEGPYFSMNQKGAQDPYYIRDPEPAEYRKIVELAKGVIVRWSIAPERKGAMEMGDFLTANGILPTIAHTDATYDDCVEALNHGYTHITHLYSCTSTITRKGGFRILGVTESAYCLDSLTVEIIADGCHLPPELLKMIVKCKGVERISLVTDSLRPAGLDVTTSIAGSLENGRLCIIEDGVAKLPDRSAFSGSIATADHLVYTMWKKAGVPLPDTIKMMAENPAKLLRIDETKGRLIPGKDADIVIFDENVKIQSVFFNGEKINE